MTHILITNDDGVNAPGLLALAQAILPLGKITVVAPDRNWSMCGHVKTLFTPLRIQTVELAEGISALAVSGAPSDCVAISLMGMLPDKVDLVVSGINPYPNLGHDLTYSGTVTAAMEAVIYGLPAIAVSLAGPHHNNHQHPVNYQTAGAVAHSVAQGVLQNGLPANTLLNVNVPYLSTAQLGGFRITRQGKRIYQDRLLPAEAGQVEYQIGGDPPLGEPEEGTDFGALADGYVSITPVHLDMTAYHLMSTLQGWRWESPAG